MKDILTVIATIGILIHMGFSPAALADDAPCSTENYHQFDFWVGKWAVETPDGKPAGDSRIQRVQDGCMVLESWQSLTSPYTGTSMNFYDPDLGQWRQIWLDNQGGKLELFGTRKDSQMILRSKAANDGSYQQISWTANEDGTVRQYWQSFSTDKEPKTLFDGKYVRDEALEDWSFDS